MTQKLSIFLLALFTLLCGNIMAQNPVDVSITMNSTSQTMTLAAKGSGTLVDVGTPNASRVYTFPAEPGDYILTGYNASSVPTGTMEISIFEGGDMLDGGGQYGKVFKITTITAGVSTADWVLGTDYQMDCYAMSREGDIRVITTADNITANRKVFMMQIGDSYRLAFTMSTARVAVGYLAAFNHSNVVTAATATATTTIPMGTNYQITVPEAASLYVGGKWGGIIQSSGGTHYTPFIDQYPVDSVIQSGKKTYTYALGQGCYYNFRAKQTGKLTHGGKFQVPSATTANPSYALEITDAMMSRQSNKYINADPSANNGANESDILHNINAEGHLKLKSGQTHLLLNLRRWQLTDNSTNNYFIEPDFNYTIIGLDGKPSNDVIEIDNNWVIRTKGAGTAIVQVTYDAIYLEQYNASGVASPYYYGALWGAILPENTGTFVVTVDGTEDPALRPNMGIRSGYNANEFVDSEHDVFYYLSSEPGYEYTFTPENVATVSLANPTLGSNISTYSGFENVTANGDGSYTLLLTRGRNIVKLTSANGASHFQILNAKPTSYEISNVTNPGFPIQPGDQVKVQFEGLFHPANKLSGIYNMSAYIVYNDIPNGTSLILSANQYQFCGTPSAQAYNVVTIPENWDVSEPYMLENGAIQVFGYGSSFGKHRAISPLAGINPNFTAMVRKFYFGSIPDVAILLNTVYAESVSLNEEAITLKEKETYLLIADVLPENATNKNVTWKSSDTNVATVDENGLVTAVSEGEATITVTTEDSKLTATCTVTVFGIITGINDAATETALRVYPNPFADYIIVKTTAANTATIYTVSGTAILNANLQNGSNRIETSALPKGVYVLKVGEKTVKIVK